MGIAAQRPPGAGRRSPFGEAGGRNDHGPLARNSPYPLKVPSGKTASAVGAKRRVLVESGETGRTEQFLSVELARPAAPGSILEVDIAGHDGRRLLGA